ncbi:MAG: hypothetical protein QOE72_4391 [Chloroflexota bacterium]|jgi:hypothetical protein|nr:hypothetical protein [Chloroflexota bacterium]
MLRSASPRRPAAVLAAGAALLGLVWLAGPASQPPLYDGPVVAEPYRYCQPPPGFAPQQPPSTVDHNVRVVNGQSPPIADSTAEQPPQAELLAPANVFVVPPGAVTIRVAMLCAPPPRVLPPDGRLDGNVYRFTVSAGGTPLGIRPGQQVTVVLRGPAGAPNPVMERFANGQWMKLDTQPLGNASPDSYAANVTALGDMALVVVDAVVPVEGSDRTPMVAALAVVAVALVAAAALLTLRRSSGRR